MAKPLGTPQARVNTRDPLQLQHTVVQSLVPLSLPSLTFEGLQLVSDASLQAETLHQLVVLMSVTSGQVLRKCVCVCVQ